MIKLLKIVIPAAAAVGVMMFATVGSASACETAGDGGDGPTKTEPTPTHTGTQVGPVAGVTVWADTAGEVSGSTAFGSGEAGVSSTGGYARLDSSGAPELGWAQGSITVTGTTVDSMVGASSEKDPGAADAFYVEGNSSTSTDGSTSGDLYGQNPEFNGGGELDSADGDQTPLLSDVQPLGQDAGDPCID
ncbi:MAG: hypothetical protein ACRDL6_11650 [Solirubrobacterales bacterium]